MLCCHDHASVNPRGIPLHTHCSIYEVLHTCNLVFEIVCKMLSGYDAGSATLYNKSGKLRNGEKEMLSCQHCGKLLRDAMQLITCGCRYCKSCIKSIIGSEM